MLNKSPLIMPFYFKIAILLISFQESYQGPADYFALDRIVAIFGWGHKLPSCFGTLLTSSHVITSASCILRLSDAIGAKYPVYVFSFPLLSL